MCAVRDGDVSRLGVLFERHHLRLFNLFRRLGAPAGSAEDLVQEVFFRMLKYRHNFRDGGEFTPWMYQLARNVSADNYRKHGREAPAPEDPPEIVDAAPLATEMLERSETERRMRRALQSLPVEKREVLVLSRYQRLKYDQIADLLGCSVGAVKLRVHRAIKDLRDAYHGDFAAAGAAGEVSP
jgi:RNA polymerase sigma-70 factor (ECF subfamily)